MPATPYQIMHARELLRLTIGQLSSSAGVSAGAINRVESGKGSQLLTRVVLRKALEAAGAEFTPDGGVALRRALR